MIIKYQCVITSDELKITKRTFRNHGITQMIFSFLDLTVLRFERFENVVI